MRHFLNNARWIAVVMSACGATGALAWGADAHHLVAELAQSQLGSAAAVEVNRLLALEPGATMATVSTWADETRSSATARLHFVNLPKDDCTYSRPRDCPDGRCVVEAIAAKVAILKSHSPDIERLSALKWVIHLVADIHQPLHVGVVDDKGGNLFQVRAFGRGSNLHAVWDKELVLRRPGGRDQLLRDVSTSRTAAPRPADPARWASESCAVGRSAEFYPDGRIIDAGYAARWDSTLTSRLALGGRRLAETLNDALGGN